MATIPSSINLQPTSRVPQALRNATPIAVQEGGEQPTDSVSISGRADTTGIYSLKDVAGFRAGSALDTNALKGNLKERIHGIQTDSVKDASTRFQETNFGSVVSSGGAGKFGELENMASSHSKNPLDNQGSGMRTSRNDMVSDDDSSPWDDFKNWAGSVVGSILSGAGAKSGPGQAAGAGAGTVAGGSWSILTANTGSADEKKDEANGIIGVYRQGATGTSNENAAAMMKSAMDDMEPVPDDMGSSPHSFTPGNVDRTKATNGSQTEPVDDDTRGGSGGPINTGASGTGATGSVSQPVDDLGNSFAFTQFDSKGIEARLTSRINIVH